MKKLLKISLATIATLLLLFGLFLLYSTLTEFKPEPIIKLSERKGSVINTADTLNVFNWNVGYCGLGNDMSFFYDGGEEMRTSKQRTIENLGAIINQIKANDSIDFYLFQEVDKKSHRSYKINQLDSISKNIQDYCVEFATNYKVTFIPVPMSNPMGKVLSGIASFTKPQPFTSERHSYKGNYEWPQRLFLLDRCFMIQRFYTSNGKEFLLINTHNSAYDDGTLRKKQMEQLKIFIVDEYNKGNYVLVGGDWNQEPPIAGQEQKTYEEKHLTRMNIAHDFLPPSWNWQFCTSVPTNRMLDEVYNPETTKTATIDFYLLSPNLTPITLKNINLNFENSDHQPVLLSFTFATN